MKVQAYASFGADSLLREYQFERRTVRDDDVAIAIDFCGICHSDLHTAHGDWGEAVYPCVPGHEIIGHVVKVGSAVTEFVVGDRVGVGCMVGSCGTCKACAAGYENSCFKETIWTYSSCDPVDGSDTKGGYSTGIVVPKHFVLHIPESLDSAHAAPLLCAGITTYSPLRHWQIGPGMKVGVIGLGGLGHMGLKYAKSFGAEVWALTTSPEKAEAARAYGADGVIVTTDESQMESAANSFDFLLDTIPTAHDVTPYLSLLGVHGAVCLVGPIEPMPGYHSVGLINGQKSIAGSGIGGIKETADMLAYSAEHNVLPEIEIIKIQDVNEAWANLAAKNTAKRYVIDMQASFPRS